MSWRPLSPGSSPSRRKQGGDPALHSECECFSVLFRFTLHEVSRGGGGVGGGGLVLHRMKAHPPGVPVESRSLQVSQISAFTIRRSSPVAHVAVVETHKFHHNGENERDY